VRLAIRLLFLDSTTRAAREQTSGYFFGAVTSVKARSASIALRVITQPNSLYRKRLVQLTHRQVYPPRHEPWKRRQLSSVIVND
jgi:hypothetical protein